MEKVKFNEENAGVLKGGKEMGEELDGVFRNFIFDSNDSVEHQKYI